MSKKLILDPLQGWLYHKKFGGVFQQLDKQDQGLEFGWVDGQVQTTYYGQVGY
jgi:hypothetical protein